MPAQPSTAVSITATDGVVLGGRVYEPVSAPRFEVLMLPGVGVPQRAFRHLASWLAEHGVRSTSVDYRGIGESRSDPRALETASMTNWASRDSVGALRFAESSAQGRPIVLIGHSFGGQMLGFSDEFRRLCAAILVCSQFGQTRHWDGAGRLKVAAFWHLILPLAASVFEPVPGWTGIGEAIPRGVAREWARWGRTHDWLLPYVAGAAERYAAFDRPLRAYAATDDPIAPPRAVSELLGRFRSTPVERVDLAPADLGLGSIGHLGLLRPGASERIWREMLDFAERHAGAANTAEPGSPAWSSAFSASER